MKYNLILILFISACSTYKFSKQTKLIALNPDVQRGRSIGPIEGKDCRWVIFGIKSRQGPTIDLAIENAIENAKLDSLESINSSNKPLIRYINNLKTENEGYNLGLIQRQCLHISGVAYI